ncbi:hypothetical protein [Turicibacter sanguinis]|uniref:hypothetical protein n=1 Tax=Turicibacter sanguinis TaxID=154288 RepID=UPI0023301B77|nr:hypothetical protein [Turicibacter sanguinis]MDB8575617.1 hypothetical protein [Turicibacter sanguinis]MDB8578747.1 hypothetical protein [Turicibacter sanguinis]MDB8584070.1 hypothetical protein [Turicibacter sanguinis]MDB8588129.1 hypothetical protein [Turicibacter sanguinis]MDB8598137.1 hypothetical protein [Turicibacter sanguinis]
MIDINKNKYFIGNKSTLKETSKYEPKKEGDSSKYNTEYMTESLLEVINFDKVKDVYTKEINPGEVPNSNDALYINGNDIFFIEFKSGEITNSEKFNIRLKMFDSLWMFTDIIQQTVNFTRTNVKYILVYNKQKNSHIINTSPEKDAIHRHVTLKAEDRLVAFGLKKFEKLYINEIYTYTQEEFEEEFVKRYSS